MAVETNVRNDKKKVDTYLLVPFEKLAMPKESEKGERCWTQCDKKKALGFELFE